MTTEHGTKSRYVMGPGEGGAPGRGCRCTACSRANRDYENHRARMILYGRWEPYVDAGPTREHVRMLSAAGIGWKRAARLAGVSTGAMSKLLYGGPGDRPPSRRIRAETEAAILAVQPRAEALGGRAFLNAAGTRRRLQALVAIGWPKARLAARLGMLPANFGDVMTREQVTAGTARAVAALYDELWNTSPAEDGHREKISASRDRNYARVRGWAPPLAWDDDSIDDPAAAAANWKRSASTQWRAADLAGEAEDLERLGYTQEQAAERLGVSRAALARAIARTREAAA